MIRTLHAGASALAFVVSSSFQVPASAPSVPGDDPSAKDDTTALTGEARMRALLAKIKDDSARNNRYLGTAVIEQIEKAVARFDDRTDVRRWRYEMALVGEYLRVGRTDDAIELGTRAVDELPGLSKRPPADECAEAVFQLGTAHMRRGENQNCCLKFNEDSCILPIQGGGLHTDKTGSTEAAKRFTRALELATPGSPVAVKARWLLNIAHMTLGTWPDGVPEPYRVPRSLFEPDEPFPRFHDVSTKVGLTRTQLAGGAAAEDFDGDGRLELVISTSATDDILRYYDVEDGRYVDRSEEVGFAGLYGGLNLMTADYDDDGDVDVLVLRGAWWQKDGNHPKSLLRNDTKDGRVRFTDVTFDAGLGASQFPSQTASFADYDNDGDLDLYVGNEQDPTNVAACELYQNQGNGTFVNVAAKAGVTNDRYTKAVIFGDYDGDRFPDIYVSNMAAPNRLYHNERDGTFRDVAEGAGVTLPISSFPTWFFDFDDDGAQDLFVAGFGGPGVQPSVSDVAASWLGLPHQGEPLHLYKGDGKGGFRDVAIEQKLTLDPLPMGSNFGDLDNDGFLDVYLGTGYPFYEGLIPNVMYRNQRGKGFANVTFAGGFGHLQKGHGVVFADLDDDGDQDVLERIGGAYPGDGYHTVLFENPGFGTHWLKVRLVGEKSNRFGVGARLKLDVVEDGVARSIYKTVNTGGSFGCNPLRQEIGVGKATKIARLEVWWPTTDARQVFRDVAVDQAIEVHEGRDAYVVQKLAPFVLGG